MPFNNYSAASPDDGKVILCVYCDRPQEVGRMAKTITCKHCYKRLNLEDVPIVRYEAHRAVETCGVVTVEPKGTIVAARVHCSRLIVRGKVKANVFSRGSILVGPTAEIKGDVTAPAIAIGAGAILDGNYTIGTAGEHG